MIAINLLTIKITIPYRTSPAFKTEDSHAHSRFHLREDPWDTAIAAHPIVNNRVRLRLTWWLGGEAARGGQSAQRWQLQDCRAKTTQRGDSERRPRPSDCACPCERRAPKGNSLSLRCNTCVHSSAIFKRLSRQKKNRKNINVLGMTTITGKLAVDLRAKA